MAKRSLIVEKAIQAFEKKTNYKVSKARKSSGSMRDFVSLYVKDIPNFIANYYRTEIPDNHMFHGVRVTFLSAFMSDNSGWLDIRWEELGIDYYKEINQK